MATDKQVEYIKSLYSELGQDYDETELMSMTIEEASKTITELKSMIDERKEKFEYKDDGLYWY